MKDVAVLFAEGGGAVERALRLDEAEESAPGLGLYEHRDAEALAREALWLGLRALDGLSCARFAEVHGYDPRQRHAEPLARLAARGLLALDPGGDRLCLTARGALFADEVGASLL